ncbi:MAG: DUF1576 domain-containing protein [Spirochaetaceae bacterium]|nr:MAG: DUF1576 domain-containing protein [Spirochaetaceae bacterium]
MSSTEKSLYRMLLFILGGTLAAALLVEGPLAALKGFMLLQQSPGRLINDFTLIAGTGGALLNASVAGFLAMGIIFLNKVRLSGPTLAAVFTIVGFSLFGKTPMNTAPILLGVFIAARIVQKPFKSYIIIALFGTALGPLTAYLAFEAGMTGVPALITGALAGILVGMILPSMAMAMLRMHEGYNLYNLGLTCGFLGLFAASILVAMQRDIAISVIWNDSPGILLTALTPGIAVVLIISGFLISGIKTTLAGIPRLLKLSGRLPTDFMDLTSPGTSLLNAGVMGLLGCAYVFIVGADFNGPVIGGLFTVIGFATFGKHPKNTLPVVVGVIAATLLFGKGLADPGPILALLFSTTLAPLSGEFGPHIGFIGGFLHLVMVERTAAWHGGLDLYNNGFAGGLVATFIVAIIEWFQSNKPAKARKK